MLDDEDFDIAFAAYEGSPVLAFILAQHLDCLRVLIQRGPQGALDAITAIDRAIDRLKPHTNFRDVDRATYHLAVTGQLKPEHEDTIRQQR